MKTDHHKIQARRRSRIRNRLSLLFLQWRKRIENVIQGGIETTGEVSFMRSVLRVALADNDDIHIIDVGANVGDWALRVAEEFSALRRPNQHLTLYTLEPLAETVLSKKYRGVSVYTEKKAVSSVPGVLKINMWPSVSQATGIATYTQSSIYERRATREEQGEPTRVEVSAVRLDDYIEQRGIPRVDLLKIDVEGHEFSVLKSLGKYLRPDFVRAVQFEYGPTYIDAGTYLFDMYELLKDYQVCKMFKHHIEATPYLHNLEDFMFANYVAIRR